MQPRSAVFLDRDGTLNRSVVREGKPYPPANLAEFVLCEGAKEACRRLRCAGFSLVVVTNQPDVGRGSQTRENVETLNRHLREIVPEIQHIEVCYHAGAAHGDPCSCRKPSPGMLLAAARSQELDLQRSWMIGDRRGDILAGQAAGCRTIWLDQGYSEPSPNPPADFVTDTLLAATAIVLAHP